MNGKVLPLYACFKNYHYINIMSSRSYVLGAFAKLRRATISFNVSVCPTFLMEQLGSHWKDYHESLYMKIFRKSVKKTQVSLKSDKNNGSFT
jgi:hypothetical protein